MTLFVLVVFGLTYLGMALGRLPWLQLDRSGICLVAAIVLAAGGAVTPAGALAAIDFPTLLLLFALMILSAQFAASGFYDRAAAALAAARLGPARLLAATVALGGGLSALLTNDVVVFALTPLLCAGLLRRGLDPRPYLIALAGAANAGSAATLIGNPQNILIGELGGLDFWRFAAACGAPAALGCLIVHIVVWRLWRDRLAVAPAPGPAALPPLDRWQLARALIGTAALLILFATPVPRPLAALAVAAVLLVSRRLASRTVLAHVDWPLLLLFAGLFVVNDALAATGLPARAVEALTAAGWRLDSLAMQLPFALGASTTVGNVPAVALLLAVWPQPPAGALYGLALLSTLAGNLLLQCSLANIIVAERAAAAGVRLGFAEHARCGIPIALASLAAASAWLVGAGHLAPL
ncbi:MAG TPA: SLC13 family permease [Alphaproteobacteria bacterium]|nr:SLC13 family permease [Alphaproteobacteria bacterium]